MHVIILGAGVVGMTTAYYLAERDCDVTVVDQASDVANGASFANGGQLSYSFTDSLAKPSFLGKLPGLVLGNDRASQVRMSASLFSWGTHFIRQCTSKRSAKNTVDLLAIAMRSASLMSEVRGKLPFEFCHRTAGKLVLLTDDTELHAARGTTALKQAHGCETTLLDRDAAIAIEPALEQFGRSIRGAVFSRSDEVADALLFSRGLRTFLEQSGKVRFQMNTRIKHVCNKTSRPLITTEQGKQSADAVVVCLGARSPNLLRPLGIKMHIYPVRGYSVTLPPGPEAPSVSVSALADRIVFSRMNGQMRIAGFADFNGFSNRNDNRRVADMLKVARQAAPKAADYNEPDCHPWGGFRPMTPTGLPYVGATAVPGLFVNTGHGMLGWTLACATAKDVASTITSGQCT